MIFRENKVSVVNLMDKFSLVTIFDIILTILGIWSILDDLHKSYHHGSCIMKLKQKKRLSILGVISLILGGMILYSYIGDYMKYGEFRIIHYILNTLFWIEISISSIIKSMRSLEIRENGIYDSRGYFYKWGKFENYNWLLPDKIQFKLKNGKAIVINIKEEFKLKLDEIIQNKITVYKE